MFPFVRLHKKVIRFINIFNINAHIKIINNDVIYRALILILELENSIIFFYKTEFENSKRFGIPTFLDFFVLGLISKLANSRWRKLKISSFTRNRLPPIQTDQSFPSKVIVSFAKAWTLLSEFRNPKTWNF